MVETQKITIQRTKKSRLSKTDFNDLPFGKVFADHMFTADYVDGSWKNYRITPYGHVQMSPATPALHYGQSIFEGLKAFRGPAGETLVFRPMENLKRLNKSAERMCMPAVPEEVFMDGLQMLIDVDREWVPKVEGGSLYIRPFLFSADEFIGIRPSQNFTFMILICPVGPYYDKPVKVKIETKFSRAIEGGTGYAKAGGNYGGAIYPTRLAQEEGYHQLIWTDAKSHQYIEESGTMNVMFVVDDVLITPALGETILHGITRDSVLNLARSWNMKVEERRVSVQEIVDALKAGRLKEAFGVGTAVTIAHIDLIGHDGTDYQLPPVEKREFANRVFREMDKLKRGLTSDPFGWVHRM